LKEILLITKDDKMTAIENYLEAKTNAKATSTALETFETFEIEKIEASNSEKTEDQIEEIIEEWEDTNSKRKELKLEDISASNDLIDALRVASDYIVSILTGKEKSTASAIVERGGFDNLTELVTIWIENEM
jgi:DNA phosphorothioation-dependent restriction protein DptG